VKRFMRRLSQKAQPPFRRMECMPGQELQVDFGQGAWLIQNGKRCKTHLFRCVLSHSRKAYSEAVCRQTSESFIRCLENAFRHFGGVTATVVIDNLKAGVIQADWFDPQLNPKLEEFARHYGTVILPTKPAMPRHKGKVEAGVKYAQNNAVKGRTFESLAAQNLFLSDWEKNVADTRIHGTTRQQVGKLFEEVERPALQALPGKFTTDPAHLNSRKRHIIERGLEHQLDRCRLIGPLAGTWAEAMNKARGPQGLRVMLGLLQLAEKHPVAQLEKAAGVAIHHGAWRLRDLKRLLTLPGNVVQLDFLETHELIRSLEAYRIPAPENLNPNQTP